MTDNSKKRARAGAGAGARARAGAGTGARGRGRVIALGAVAAVAAVLSGCATTTASTPPPPTVKLVPTAGSSVPSVQLTQLGATRIGLETAQVTVSPAGEAVFPYTALLYEPDGQAAVYVASGPLTFTRHFVDVDTIDGWVVSVKSGVTPGQRVATAGSQELLGVQNGVGEET